MNVNSIPQKWCTFAAQFMRIMGLLRSCLLLFSLISKLSSRGTVCRPCPSSSLDGISLPWLAWQQVVWPSCVLSADFSDHPSIISQEKQKITCQEMYGLKRNTTSDWSFHFIEHDRIELTTSRVSSLRFCQGLSGETKSSSGTWIWKGNDFPQHHSCSFIPSYSQVFQRIKWTITGDGFSQKNKQNDCAREK